MAESIIQDKAKFAVRGGQKKPRLSKREGGGQKAQKDFAKSTKIFRSKLPFMPELKISGF